MNTSPGICLVVGFIFKIRKLRLRVTKKHNEDHSAKEKWDLKMAATPRCLRPLSHHCSGVAFFHWVVVPNRWESCRSTHQKSTIYYTQILYWLWVYYTPFKTHPLKFKEPRLILSQGTIFFLTGIKMMVEMYIWKMARYIHLTRSF